MENEVLYKGNIRIISKNFSVIEDKKIIFRILNYKNTYYFAEEIITGSLFPVYNFCSANEKNRNQIKFKEYSYLKSGRYFIYLPTISNKIFEFSISEKHINNSIDIIITSVEEVNSYIKKYSKDENWKKEIVEMSLYNEYCDDIDIKEIKNVLKENINIGEEKTIENIHISKIYTPIIDIEEIEEFGYDLSTQTNLCNLIGREEEKKSITKSIGIKNKSILIIGPSGSGKTSIIESLADEIRKGTNKWLNNKMIFYVNISSLIQGTKYRGEFEKKFQKLIDFCVKNKEKIILFIDEIHNLYGLGKTEDSSIDAMNILKPYIIRRDLTIIGATTNQEYNEYMTIDPAFENRFDKLILNAPDEKMNIEILLSYIEELEKTYNIKLNLVHNKKQEIAKYIINITDKKNQNVVGDIKVENPKIAKNIIEDAFVEAIYNESKEVTVEDISLAILSCSKLSPTFRREKAEILKQKILMTKETNNKTLVLTKISK